MSTQLTVMERMSLHLIQMLKLNIMGSSLSLLSYERATSEQHSFHLGASFSQLR